MKITSGGSQFVPCGQTDGQTDETVTFRSIAHEPNVEFLRYFMHLIRLS